LVAINVQPLTIAAAAAGVAPTMCTHLRCQRLAATIVKEELELAATFVEEELELWHHSCL
jgi:predicted aconitase